MIDSTKYCPEFFIMILDASQQHGFPRLSLAIIPYRSSLFASPPDDIQYIHRAFASRSTLVCTCEGIDRSTLL